MNWYKGKKFLAIYMMSGILILLLIIESFLAVYRKHQTTVVEQQKRQLGTIASIGADYLKTYVDEKNLEIQNMFTFKALGKNQEQAKGTVEKTIKLYWSQSPLYLDYMRYFNLSDLDDTNLIGMSTEEFNEYIERALRSNELIVGPWRKINVDNVGIYLFKGIYNEYGKYGVLVCRVNLMMVFHSTISKIQLGEQGYLSLSDIDGSFYLNGNREGIFLKEEEDHLRKLKTMLMGYSITDIGGINFLVTAQMPYFEIKQPILITFYLLNAISIGVVAIFGVLTSLVFRMRKRKLEYAMELKLQEKVHQAGRNETLALFSRKVAHEYNNLLSPIMIYCELLKDELKESDEMLKEYAEEIYRSCEACAKLARGLLEYGRSIPAESINTPYDVNEVIKSTIKKMQLILPKEVKLQCNLPAEPTFLIGQPIEIVQIIYNLGINSVHAMESGGTLTITLQKGKKEVILTVSDTGCGIPKHLLKKLFNVQFTTKTNGKGNGLGLTIVASIVDKYKGKVTCTSKEGVGTTFTICLPSYDEGLE